MPKRFKVAWGGRGSAKSTSIALMLLTRAKQKKTRILCAREVQNSISDSVHKLLKDLVNNTSEFNDFEVLQTTIRHANGSEFIFKGLRHNINDVKSTEGVDICWVEEAQSVTSESWDVLVPTIREDSSEIWISFNPDMEDDPTYDRFVKNADLDNSIILKVNYDNNPFFNDTLRAEMERDKKRDYGKYLHIWEGEFKKTTDSAVFKNWNIEDFETPNDAEFLFGADWGFSQDPTTLIRSFIIGDNLYIDYEAFGYQTQIDDTAELFDTIPLSRKYIIRADNARPEMVAHIKRQGFNIVSAEKWAGSIEDGITWINKYDVLIHPRCKNIIQEFAKYSYKIHRLTGDILPDIIDDYNHGIDALRYSLQPLIKKKSVGFFTR